MIAAGDLVARGAPGRCGVLAAGAASDMAVARMQAMIANGTPERATGARGK